MELCKLKLICYYDYNYRLSSHFGQAILSLWSENERYIVKRSQTEPLANSGCGILGNDVSRITTAVRKVSLKMKLLQYMSGKLYNSGELIADPGKSSSRLAWSRHLSSSTITSRQLQIQTTTLSKSLYLSTILLNAQQPSATLGNSPDNRITIVIFHCQSLFICCKS